jgi:hypothetical protein
LPTAIYVFFLWKTVLAHPRSRAARRTIVALSAAHVGIALVAGLGAIALAAVISRRPDLSFLETHTGTCLLAWVAAGLVVAPLRQRLKARIQELVLRSAADALGDGFGPARGGPVLEEREPFDVEGRVVRDEPPPPSGS